MERQAKLSKQASKQASIAGGADRVQAKFVENSLAGRVQNAGINRFHLKIGP